MDDKISGVLLEFRLEEFMSPFSSSSSMSATMISSSLACQVPMLAKKFVSKCINIVGMFGDYIPQIVKKLMLSAMYVVSPVGSTALMRCVGCDFLKCLTKAALLRKVRLVMPLLLCSQQKGQLNSP